MMREWVRGLRARLPHVRRGPTILLYHRIAEPGSDPFSLCVSPSHFSEHLEVLSRDYTPLRLRELSLRARDGSLPANAVAVTFDDGYRDNLAHAVPLLAWFDIPATVFIASGQVGEIRGFWWDELERIVLRPLSLPPALELDIGGHRHRWEPTGAHASAQRARFFQELYRLLIALPEAQRVAAQDALLDWAGAAPQAPDEDRALAPQEVAAMAAAARIELGAHSVSHPLMSRLPYAEQLGEARQSKRAVEALAGRAVESFAYPYGDFSDSSVAAAREAGFQSACTCDLARVSAKTDPLRLPRLEVRGGDGERFARSLRWLMA